MPGPRRQCVYQGEGCLGEFELSSGHGGSNRLHCNNCQKLAARRRGAHYASSHRTAELLRGKNRRRRLAKAAGRRYREMTSMQPCLYRDPAGNPGKDCRGEFKPKSGIQRFCDNCRRLARNDRQRVAAMAAYYADKKLRSGPGRARHEKRLQRGRKSAARYHQRLRELAAEALRLRAQQPARKGKGRTRKDDIADRVVQLKRTGLSWSQLTIKLNEEARRAGSQERNEEAYRSLYRSRKPTVKGELAA